MKVKRFLVTGNWVDKETLKPMSGMAEVTGGTNKNGHKYEIAATDKRETIEGTYAVGTILTASISFATQPQAASGRAQTAKSSDKGIEDVKL
jgi:hypothetical protein